MKHAENNTQEMAAASSQEAWTNTAPKIRAAAVVSGPSCPAAFARWWAEYQEKVMKKGPVQRSVFKREGRP